MGNKTYKDLIRRNEEIQKMNNNVKKNSDPVKVSKEIIDKPPTQPVDQKPKKPILTFSELKELIMIRISDSLRRPGKIWYDDRNKKTVDRIIKYFMNDDSRGSINPNMSIWIRGYVGTAKSTLFKCINKECLKISPLVGNSLKTFIYQSYTELIVTGKHHS